jgi:carbamoyl-phosphate synthase large subunit
VMGIGRNFQEALQKACQSLEIRRNGLGADGKELTKQADLLQSLEHPSWNRLFHVYDAMKLGISMKTIQNLTKIDKWFLEQIWELIELEKEIEKYRLETIPATLMRTAKEKGYADRQIAHLLDCKESEERWASTAYIKWWTPVRPSLMRKPHITTPPSMLRTNRR